MKIFNFLTSIATLILIGACSEDKDPVANPDLGEASYKVTFASTWTGTTHPDSYPGNPHFSGLIGMTHNVNQNLWEVGEVSSTGIEQVAETGAKTITQEEIETRISIGDTDKLISENGLGAPPTELSFTVVMKPDFSYISLVSMLAPSPDWIVGVDALNLAEDGVWINSKTVDLYVYDAGTDDGSSYTSTDANSEPKQNISRIETTPFLVNGTVIPIGTMTFEKQ